MLRKLIMFAIASGLVKKAHDSYRRQRTPFPTAAHHPRRPARGRG